MKIDMDRTGNSSRADVSIGKRRFMGAIPVQDQKLLTRQTRRGLWVNPSPASAMHIVGLLCLVSKLMGDSSTTCSHDQRDACSTS